MAFELPFTPSEAVIVRIDDDMPERVVPSGEDCPPNVIISAVNLGIVFSPISLACTKNPCIGGIVPVAVPTKPPVLSSIMAARCPSLLIIQYLGAYCGFCAKNFAMSR